MTAENGQDAVRQAAENLVGEYSDWLYRGGGPRIPLGSEAGKKLVEMIAAALPVATKPAEPPVGAQRLFNLAASLKGFENGRNFSRAIVGYQVASNRNEALGAFMLMIAERHPDCAISEYAIGEVPHDVLAGLAGQPQPDDRELLRKALDELRDAASSVYSETSGSTQTFRAHRVIEGMRESLRQAWCVLKGKEYVPMPDGSDDADLDAHGIVQ